jgi:hypothetical protein
MTIIMTTSKAELLYHDDAITQRLMQHYNQFLPAVNQLKNES